MVLTKFTITVPEDTPGKAVAQAIINNSIGHGGSCASFYLTGLEDNELTFCEISSAHTDAEDALNKYLARHKIQALEIQSKEITVREFAELLEDVSANGVGPDQSEILGANGMMPFITLPFASSLSEIQCPGTIEKQELSDVAEGMHLNSLEEEAQRIFANGKEEFCGHPVLYSVSLSKAFDSQNISGLLIAALHSVGRLKSGRAVILSFEERPLPNELFDEVYLAQSGSTVIVNIPNFEDAPEKKEIVNESLKYICELANESRDSVLTIFISEPGQREDLDYIEENLKGTVLYRIQEDKTGLKEAERRLRAMAKNAGCKSVAGLCKSLEKGKELYSENELKEVFFSWYDKYLKSVAYPQYKVLGKNEAKCIAESKDSEVSAFDELSQLIGLTQAKAILSQARDFAKAQKIYIKRGFSTMMPCLHMAFCGNPGTAKTTVARLTARIFKECGVLEKGDLIEVSRSDLIGKYVGWTAKAVSEKFKAAEGSVLFIDEAYSLLDDRENMFGDEAINQITLEMENHRDNVVVIFAGYKEPMEKLISRNAGLKSRIAFKVDFPDYTEEEMLQIVHMNLKANGREVTRDGEEKVRQLIRSEMSNPYYGNGRYAREIVEQAMLSQASRIVAIPEDKITDDGIRYLIADDFPDPIKKEPKPARIIGFACA